ncbi:MULTISPECIES: CPBP family intramembrane glutamic endopeptidase [Streptomyces]|uniref:CPBP family intramembrane glutamic endopeptidase n=1 Tax=Streptomyces TaxID=1883 RepID=UPI0011639063|nr:MULTISPECIES: CPBP family intramembrane glutamic endopeptidase [unclassified Streptomyces]QDN54345.1 CPBP family intramembrane metalloprotease [Streptomyces sp. S1D4-20]QDN64527.1 CPBP family intramembrane metalloprotease [Streptomyces sp. S1D4-14]QDN74847.1 CPBP family intramembrane metalloprotease [Streptomyces sp. S1A1-7]QDO55556.1 CPBP family intramembrane metalloprotease [Streptomyces sp. RLB3-5]QDO57177.1 CPBP family intramembrane metalloprotease [Streptomyces sp. RLB1-8]
MSTPSAAQHEEGSRPDEDGGGRGGRLGRIVRAPLGWMLTGMVGVGLASGLTATGPGPVPVLGAVAAVAVYWVVMRRVAGRSTPEIARQGAGREALRGGAVGLGFVLVSALLITAFGGYSFSWAGNGFFSVVWSAAMVQAGAAVTEELMFRGFALQALEQRWGSRAAIVITGLFFGVAHLGAPGAGVWSALAIALEAGVMLGVAFLWRRNIWFVAGLHFTWNTAEQLLGIPVSGHTPKGLFTVDTHGSALLSGGTFGLEASIVPVLIGVLLTVRMFVLAGRSGGLRPRRLVRH